MDKNITHPLVSIITVNFNGLKDTCEMIDSFHKYETYPNYEVIVVDNGSKAPEEADKIRQKRLQNVRVIKNINNGFAGGNNVGMKAAKGEFFFFINNDTLIKEPVIENLLCRFHCSCTPHVGAVSPMLKYSYQPDTIQYAGFTPFTPVTLRNHSIGCQEKDAPCYHTASPTASLHGAAMMVSREAVDAAGPMTEVYFLFYEEFDWSAQIKKAGFSIWYEPAVTVYHKESMTARKDTPFREFYLSRARILFARRNLTGFKKILSCLFITAIATPKKALVYLLRGKFSLSFAAIKGTLTGLCIRPIE